MSEGDYTSSVVDCVVGGDYEQAASLCITHSIPKDQLLNLKAIEQKEPENTSNFNHSSILLQLVAGCGSRNLHVQAKALCAQYSLSVCEYCFCKKAQLKRPKTGSKICKECFYIQFETEIHETITQNDVFTRGEKVAVCASGGKDSTVLAHVMKLLNERYDYGLDLFLLSVDEGISGYRDDSLETVKRNQIEYQLPLTIVSYKDLYGWSMDDIVKAIGKKNNCTFCGVFRRQALDRGAMKVGANKLVTGHNCDDIAETVVMNILRGDISRLGRCVDIVTGRHSPLPRAKPFKYTYEKEIVMYAHYKQLDYFSTECIYSPFAYRGHTREFLKDLEKAKNKSLVDIIKSMEYFQVKEHAKAKRPGLCVQCGYMSSQVVCKACVLLKGLNQGKPKISIGKNSDLWAQGKLGKGEEGSVEEKQEEKSRRKENSEGKEHSQDHVALQGLTGAARRQAKLEIKKKRWNEKKSKEAENSKQDASTDTATSPAEECLSLESSSSSRKNPSTLTNINDW